MHATASKPTERRARAAAGGLLVPRGAFVVAACFLIAIAPAAAIADSEDERGRLEGDVELVYRSVQTDGSEAKFEEDFDGLESGLRLGNLSARWTSNGPLDHGSIQLSGLGGDPREFGRFVVGRKDAFDLTVTHRLTRYRYDLFDLVDDEDGHAWNSERSLTDIDLTIDAAPRVKLAFGFQDSRRSGDSIFLKDLQREVFLLEAPIDVRRKRYSAGVDLDLGAVDLVFRQSVERHRRVLDSFTEGDLGIEPTNNSSLESYDWRQRESGSTDLTTLIVRADAGRRVRIEAALQGTLLGERELSSDVGVNAVGVSFTGAPFAWVDGFSNVDLEGDRMHAKVDVSVELASRATLVLEHRRFDNDLDGTGSFALEGRTCTVSGTSCATDGDCDPVGFPGDVCGQPATIATSFDQELRSSTAAIEVRPVRSLTLRGGYRLIDRELTRDGFASASPLRDADFESDGDETVVFGATWKPADWVRLAADFEDGDIDRAFTTLAPTERERTRVRATFRPREEVFVEAHWLDHESRNADPVFASVSEGTTWTLACRHRPNDRIDYGIRYSDRELETAADILFDTAGFGGTEAGQSTFDLDGTNWTASVNARLADRWRASLRVTRVEADGGDRFLGDPTGSAFFNERILAQEFDDAEIGVQYDFDSGMFLGAAFRRVDYGENNVALDYDADLLTFRGGFRF